MTSALQKHSNTRVSDSASNELTPAPALYFAEFGEHMKTILISSAATLALTLSAIYVFGDVARPKPSPTPAETAIADSRLTIVVDNKAWDATLQISEGTLKEIQEGAAHRGDSASLTQSITHSSTRTIM